MPTLEHANQSTEAFFIDIRQLFYLHVPTVLLVVLVPSSCAIHHELIVVGGKELYDEFLPPLQLTA